MSKCLNVATTGAPDSSSQGLCKGCFVLEVPPPSVSWKHPKHCSEQCMATSAVATRCREGAPAKALLTAKRDDSDLQERRLSDLLPSL